MRQLELLILALSVEEGGGADSENLAFIGFRRHFAGSGSCARLVPRSRDACILGFLKVAENSGGCSCDTSHSTSLWAPEISARCMYEALDLDHLTPRSVCIKVY
jgi:hypothetical protein